MDVIELVDKVKITPGRFFTNSLRDFKPNNDTQEFRDFLIVIDTNRLSLENKTKLLKEINKCIRNLLCEFSEYETIQKESFSNNCYKIGIKKINEIL